MVCINQVYKGCRQPKYRRSITPALQECPQKKGVCVKIFTQTPRKPNSAIRKICSLRLSNNKVVFSYIPGEGGHTLKQYSIVLIRGGRVKDLPGVKYHLIRGKFDLYPIVDRKQARSKYGTKIKKYY
ncbi:unnamed protein product [Chrysoparadoxa australica]